MFHHRCVTGSLQLYPCGVNVKKIPERGSILVMLGQDPTALLTKHCSTDLFLKILLSE